MRRAIFAGLALAVGLPMSNATAATPHPNPVDPGSAPASKARVVFADDFDHEPPWGDAEPWSTTNWFVQSWQLPPSYPTLVRTPGAAGGWSMSAKSSPDQPNPYRTEISPDSKTFTNKFRDDREYVVSFDTYVRRYDADAPSWMTILQFHGTPGRGPGGAIQWQCLSGRNPVSITLAEGKYGVNINTKPARQAPDGALADQDVWQRRLTLKTWVHWTIRLIPSQTSKGRVQVWKDGRLVASDRGRNKDRNDQCGHPDTPIVFVKFGTYKEFENTGTQVVLFDNVVIKRVR